MALVNFYRGLREKYNPDTYKDGLYFSTDTLEIILNGSSFGGGLTNVEFSEGKLTFSFANGTVKEVPIDEATQDLPGLLSALDKQKLDNLPTGTEITEDISGLEEKVGTNDYSGSNYLEGEANLTDAVKELDTQLKTANNSLSQSIEQLNQEAIKEVQLDGVAITPSDNKVNIPLASQSADGVMSSEDKTKLNKIVDTGDGTQYLTNNGTYVPLDKNSVGLGNVDNTADLDKPISTATQSALDGKVDKEEGKSLVANSLITKLEGLDDQDTMDAAIENVKNTIDQYTVNGHKISENPTLTKTDVGLGNVTNEAQIPLSQKGAANGVATLSENGKVPASQLPTYVDDVLEGTLVSTTEFTPNEGQQGEVKQSGVVYVDTTTNKSYRWSGSQYVMTGSDLALGETSSTAYAGDKGKQVTDRVAEVYSANSVINGLSDIIFDSDDTEAQTLSADNALKTWDGSGTSHDMKIPYATTSKAGVMSATDKTKVNGALQTANAGVGVLAAYAIAAKKVAISPTDTINQAIGKLEKALNDLAGDGDGSVAEQIQEAIATLVGGASEGYQTLKELEDAINAVQGNLTTHINDKDNPHEVTKVQVGLGNVDNTSDANKPVSTAQQAAIDSAKSTIDAYTVNGKEIGDNPTINAGDVPITDTLGYFDSTNVEDALQETKQPLDTHLQNNTPGLKHIPSGGAANQVLAWESNGTARWDSIANLGTTTEDMLAYGVEWDTSVLDPTLTRIGNTSLHKSLPIQSGMYGCICQGATIRYRLAADDWRFRREPITTQVNLQVNEGVITITADAFSTLQYDKQWVRINDIKIQVGSIDTDSSTATLVNNEYTGTLQAGSYTCELGSVRNGYDGTVKVYVPGFYIKSVSEENIRRVWLSTSQIDTTYTYQQPVLVDAYRCTVLNTVPQNMGYLSTLPANTAVSIANTNTYCRGGNNNSGYDQYLESDPRRTQLGKPRTSLSRATMRGYASNAKAHLISYEEYKNIFYWLYVVEYANFNSQATYSSSLDDNGYKQGGLGSGVTTMNGNVWSGYNSYYPLTPCGYLDNLGNGSGIEPQVLEAFEMQITPTVNWSSWANSTYSDNGTTYSKATMQKSAGTLTITNVARSGQILYTSSLVAVGQATYTISGLQEGQQITFTCSGQTTQTASSDGQITMNWGVDGAQTRNINANFTGACNITIVCNSTTPTTAEYPSQSITVNRWRGFDNPFGDIWTNLDGIIVDADANNHGNNMDYVYTCNDPSKFEDTLTEDYVKTAESIHQDGYVKAFDLGETANIIASQVGGSATTYMCDYHWTGDKNTTLRTVLVGGRADNGAHAGLGSLTSYDSVSLSYTNIGFRSVSVLGS